MKCTADYEQIKRLALNDVGTLRLKGESYGDSWKARGGVGAFMMLARKWDRIEGAARAAGWDVLAACARGARAGLGEGLLDDIRDLRAYLLLVEDEALRQAAEDGSAPGRGYVDQDSGGAPTQGGGSPRGGPRP